MWENEIDSLASMSSVTLQEKKAQIAVEIVWESERQELLRNQFRLGLMWVGWSVVCVWCARFSTSTHVLKCRGGGGGGGYVSSALVSLSFSSTLKPSGI